jgi:PAS domain S-box-containing protein
MAGFWEKLRGKPASGKARGFARRDPADRAAGRETEQQRDEAQREIVTALPVPVLIVALSGNGILYVNQLGIDLFGLPVDGLADFDIRTLYADPDGRLALVEQLNRGGGRAIGVEMRMKKCDGTPFWGLLSSNRTQYRGQPAIISTCAVIDRRKKLEEQLREAEQSYRRIFDMPSRGFSSRRQRAVTSA